MLIIIKNLINLSRFYKQTILIAIESLILILVLYASFVIRLGYFYIPIQPILALIIAAPIIAMPIFIKYGLYNSIIRYMGLKSAWDIAKAVSLYSLIWGVVVFLTAVYGIPRSVILINWLFAIISILGFRLFARWILLNKHQINAINVLIYGAGSAGRQLYIALKDSREYKPIAFIDDNDTLHGKSINGINVISPTKVFNFIKKNDISEILLAIPSASRKRRNEIIKLLISNSVLVRTLPSLSKIAQGKIQIDDLFKINIDDLLGRKSIKPDNALMKKNITNKVVFVTGAGGSIGSEMCRQILALKPKILILYELNEFSLYSISSHLSEINNNKVQVKSILGSVNDEQRLSNVFQKYDVQTIYHTAAYKHVPMVEFNSSQGVINNIFGTVCCAKAAISNNVATFVLISTDKAVRPTNTMGATKRFSEMMLQALSVSQKITCFSIVRFGNVLDSSGSVIPLFKKQIKAGGPVTVTDPKIIRYFMTIPEAVELVIQAGSMSRGGEVFLLDMGEPILILDLAKKMIALSGLHIKDDNNPDGDIEISFTGLRSGEKLYEELLIGQNAKETPHSKIMSANEEFLKLDDLEIILGELKTAIGENNMVNLRKLLIKAIPEFKPQSKVQDLMHFDK